MRNKIKTLLKRDPVAVIAVTAALLSMVLTPPDKTYIGYFDLKVLAILFCLMTAIAGLKSTGVFAWAVRKLPDMVTDRRGFSLVMVNAAFFSSMLMTNDVALLALVPLTIAILGRDEKDLLIPVVVLETAAANLGSMMTPIGNPQNLYIFSHYSMGIGDFFSLLWPYGLLSLLLLEALTLLCGSAPLSFSGRKECPRPAGGAKPYIFGALFVFCCLGVLRLVDYRICLAVTAAVTLIVDRRVLARIDWGLLLTFAAFFVFVGNISRLPAVEVWLSSALAGRELLVSAAVSQVISNVPAAVLLSGFTNNAGALLLGVDIGGLGTPVASLASLISFRIYCRESAGGRLRYMLVFTAVNILLLGLLLLLAALLGHC